MKTAQAQPQDIVKHIHFVGIGGCGMSGIADVLLSKGYKVTGSDVKENKVIVYLRERGAEVFIGHAAENIQGAELIVLSGAILETNPEVIAAKELNIPRMVRAEMLAEIMDQQKGIAIAGTHGKTTTTSLTTSILREGKFDPTFLIGGTLKESGSNAELGTGEYCVAEADESDASFLFLNPKISVLTNIDVDHLWLHDGNFQNLKQIFKDFIARLPEDGLAIVCIDDEINRDILPDITKPVLTYGFSKEADVQICHYEQHQTQSRFQLKFTKKNKVLDIVLNLPGEHNALNAAGAAIVAEEIGVNDIAIKAALMKFEGVGRRFQIRGEYKVNGATALLIDDYGHHPKEIAATLTAARAAWPEKRIVLAFQPHRYSRTNNLFEDFAQVLAKPDALILLDVFPAGEKPIAGADGLSLQQAIKEHGQKNVTFVSQNEDLAKILPNVIKDGDVLIMQGAGDIGTMAASLI
jgi:UDP-N-acetylmuramate--alanine ligase